MIRLSKIKERMNDFKKDSTAGVVDMNTKGLRAINGVIDEIKKHDWPECIEDTVLMYSMAQKEYPVPELHKCPVAVIRYEDILSAHLKNLATAKRYSGFGNNILDVISIDGERSIYLDLPSVQCDSYDGIEDTDLTRWIASDDTIRLRNVKSLGTKTSIAFSIDTVTNDKATIEYAYPSTVDLSAYEFLSTGSYRIMLSPDCDASKVLEMRLRLTDSLGSYVEFEKGNSSNGLDFTKGKFMEIAFDLEDSSDASVTDIDWTKIAKVSITITYLPTFTGCKLVSIEDIKFSTITFVTYRFYHNGMVTDNATGNLIAEFDGVDDEDYLNLPQEMTECIARLASAKLRMQMDHSPDDVKMDSDKGNELLAIQKSLYPSLRLKPESPRIIFK